MLRADQLKKRHANLCSALYLVAVHSVIIAAAEGGNICAEVNITPL
jgi:hypothetical protein